MVNGPEGDKKKYEWCLEMGKGSLSLLSRLNFVYVQTSKTCRA